MRLFAPRRDWAGWGSILDFLDIDFHRLTFLTWTTSANLSWHWLSSTIVIFDFYQLSWRHSLTFQPPSYYVWTIILINGFSIIIKSRVTIFCLDFYQHHYFAMSHWPPYKLCFRRRCWPSLMWPMCVQQFATVTCHMWRCWWPCWWLSDDNTSHVPQM